MAGHNALFKHAPVYIWIHLRKLEWWLTNYLKLLPALVPLEWCRFSYLQNSSFSILMVFYCRPSHSLFTYYMVFLSNMKGQFFFPLSKSSQSKRIMKNKTLEKLLYYIFCTVSLFTFYLHLPQSKVLEISPKSIYIHIKQF